MKIVLLGSGGLRIGQAGEFDYSGSQAIKALKEEGHFVILVNPNIATIQTDNQMADTVYLEPLNLSSLTQIIEKERPDAILLGFGGQTALNLGLALEKEGILARYGVEVLGTSVESIRLSEDRELFKQNLASIGVKTPRSFSATTVEEALAAAQELGYPVMMRSGFSLGGLGSGKIQDSDELKKRAREALSKAPQILIEEYLFGWKEIEYEIVRDHADNCVTVCNMENFDPMGIHTGESIVVAPSQTLSNRDYHFLRNVALQVARHFKIIGECNIQYAVSPHDGDYRVIEINARLSRSSALASKATGYPLAFVAAKLSLGKRLDEIRNSVTKKTSAFFEPALDYLVVKIPRWDTHKLRAADRKIGTEMKSVGEVMAIGRSFPEALQKAVRMLAIGAHGVTSYPLPLSNIAQEIEVATDRRLFALGRFFLEGGTVDEAHKLSHIDPFFLHHVERIALFERSLKEIPLTAEKLKEGKKLGFSDLHLAALTGREEKEMREERLKHNIRPCVKQIDTLAGEFEAETRYLYMTYQGSEDDLSPSHNKPTIILGSGPYCIGSSVEFDWCAVNTSRAFRSLGKETILINSNPETVSTDYDESDRLYFEELTLERVRDIADFEALEGIILSVGGQIANNLACPLDEAGYPLLGTKAASIDRAENRAFFSALLHKLGIDQPRWISATTFEAAKEFAKEVGYPLLVRPSYVLSGAAMNVASSDKELQNYLAQATRLSPKHPVVLSEFILDAKELEIDGVAKEGEIVIQAISEHIENAGVHSGDATIVLPPQHLYLETIRRAKNITQEICRALAITGPFNIQFIAKQNSLKVIECNLRASRSFPFVSKVTGHNFIEIASKILCGVPTPSHFETLELNHVGVKTPQFSYSRLKGAHPVAHVEMASTGEVACIGDSLNEAFVKSWLATEQPFPQKAILATIGTGKKLKFFEFFKHLETLNFDLYTTEGTHDFLAKRGIGTRCVYKASEKIEPNITTQIVEKKFDLIINIPTGKGTDELTDGYHIRRLAIDHHIPLITNTQIALIFLQSLLELKNKPLKVKSLSEYNEKLPT